MTQFQIAKYATLVVTLVGSLLSATQTCATTTYSISQSGWSNGATVTGFFSGEDLNHDGYIALVNGEVDAYQITFSGNALIPNFTHSLADLQFFRYTIGSPGFRPSFPLYSFGSGYFYDADDYLIGLPNLSVTTFTHQNAMVSIPEPTTVSIFVAGLIGLTVLSHRRRRYVVKPCKSEPPLY